MRLAGVTQTPNRNRDRRPDGLLDESGRRPDLVEPLKLLRPFGWVARQFPRRRHNVVSAWQKFALPGFDCFQHVLNLVAIETENSNSVGDFGDLAMAHFRGNRLFRHTSISIVDRGADRGCIERTPDRADMFGAPGGPEWITDKRDVGELGWLGAPPPVTEQISKAHRTILASAGGDSSIAPAPAAPIPNVLTLTPAGSSAGRGAVPHKS